MQTHRGATPRGRRDVLRAAAGLAGGLLLPGAHGAFAQSAQKPLRFIVGFPAGGATDVIARMIADRLRPAHPAGVIVENRVGASARLAIDFVKGADPDGSTLLFTPDFVMTVYPHSFRRLNYDPQRDFAPVTPSSRSTMVLTAGSLMGDGVRSVSDFVQWCREHPKQASYATTGAGATPHFLGVMLSKASGVEMTAVHYKGGAPALQDLLGGQIAVSVNPLAEVLPHVRSGRLKALATSGSARSPWLPEVPTLVESGFKGLVVETWLGFFAPARTPPEIVARLQREVVEAAASDELRQGMEKFAIEPYTLDSAAFARQIRADTEAWGPVVRASGFTAED
jgi:tripartite-type tricarboxylate transporter receptor subunit TctC